MTTFPSAFPCLSDVLNRISCHTRTNLSEKTYRSVRGPKTPFRNSRSNRFSGINFVISTTGSFNNAFSRASGRKMLSNGVLPRLLSMAVMSSTLERPTTIGNVTFLVFCTDSSILDRVDLREWFLDRGVATKRFAETACSEPVECLV